MIKLNNADEYEPIEICLTPDKTPIAYQNKVQCLMNSGLSEDEAKREAYTPIELELYYETDSGLFAIEPGAVESGTVYSPYSGNLCEDAESE